MLPFVMTRSEGVSIDTPSHFILETFVYFVKVIINVAIEIKVPTDDIPTERAGGTFHD